jgi:hypothetical protein
MIEYPSQRVGAAGPPEPMLLDTCVIQNLDWVHQRSIEIEAHNSDEPFWSETRYRDLQDRYGEDLAGDLLDLGRLVQHFEDAGGFPWLVSASARGEFERVVSDRQVSLLDGWRHLRGLQEEWHVDAYAGVTPSVLDPSEPARINPLILRGLGVSCVDEIDDPAGPLRFLRDAGDRALVRDALVSGTPAILTTDVRSFWARRIELYEFGVEVWRPSHVLAAYRRKWALERPPALPEAQGEFGNA